MKAKKEDFVEIVYTGYLLDGTIFDTNDEAVAKAQGLDSSNLKPLRFKQGSGFVVKGLDEAIVDKEVDKEYEVELEPEQAFGKRSKDLIRLIPLTKFYENQLNPVVGLQVEINGQLGVVKSVTGGRVLVDFNHPLAGRKVKYKFKIQKIFDKLEDKLNVVFEMILNQTAKNITVKDDVVSAELDLDLNDELKKYLIEQIKKYLPELENKTIELKSTKEAKKEE
ncbi:MAG: hypothetical protein PWP03_678 [Candidatus Woesearchaeota archaeon]|nr:hypothetical protein [Candidatus Woesearchaeota archaeon]